MTHTPRSPFRIHPLSVLAAFFVAGLLLLLGYALVMLSAGRSGESLAADPNAPFQAVTIIPAPTETPRLPTLAALPTATPESPILLSAGVIGIGSYVKVGRTEGAGLRMRAGASTAADVRFIAYDDEVFRVIGGPSMADGYTWWQIEALYDQSRSGWSVDSFLDVVEIATPTP